jgi:hypothetical protein
MKVKVVIRNKKELAVYVDDKDPIYVILPDLSKLENDCVITTEVDNECEGCKHGGAMHSCSEYR